MKGSNRGIGLIGEDPRKPKELSAGWKLLLWLFEIVFDVLDFVW
jgi:hypothetical protein